MSFESRLKTSLEREADALSPDVGAALTSVRRRHETRRRVRIATYSVAVAGIVAAGVVGGPRVVDALRSEQSAPAGPHTGTSAYSRIAGVYTTRIAERPGLVRTYHLQGLWRMRLSATGDIALTPPLGFAQTLGVPADTRFELTKVRLVTDSMYHAGLGCTAKATYSWTLGNDTLRLTPVHDACPYRPAVLGAVWTREGDE